MNIYEKTGAYIAHKHLTFKFEGVESINAANAEIERFQKKYSTDVLRSTKKDKVYDTFFRLDNNSNSMLAELRKKGKGLILATFGSLGQFENNCPFHQNGTNILVGRGYPNTDTIITKMHACELGYQIIQGLADCSDYLKYKDLVTFDDYVQFESFANSKLGPQTSRDWVHKYLSLMYPYMFTEFQGNDYRKKALKALGVEPDNSIFGTDWQFFQIMKCSGISHPYEFAHVIYGIPEVTNAIKGKKIRSILPEKEITLGNFGDWQVNPNSISLIIRLEGYAEKSIPFPEEIDFFFAEVDLPDTRTINIEYKGEKYHPRIEFDETGGYLELDDNFYFCLRQYCIENECDVALTLTRKRKNVYKGSLLCLPLSELIIPEDEEDQVIQAAALSEKRLFQVANSRSTKSPEERSVTITQRHRDPYIAQYAKNRANGRCVLCQKPAPFNDINGVPYLESHHIEFLSEGGEDSIKNTVALCPNCHKRVHILRNPEDKEKLIAYNEQIK